MNNTDIDNIVPRLRIMWTSCSQRINDERYAAADLIEALLSERDEARREILESLHPDVRESHAAARGWVFPTASKGDRCEPRQD